MVKLHIYNGINLNWHILSNNNIKLYTIISKQIVIQYTFLNYNLYIYHYSA